MRPIKLTITGFGPYAGKTVLEMDRLGTRGLYLITGDTGAGKTTIFDAIVYALYGEASGGNREPFMFRSKYALPETPTEVELVFAYGDREYTVKRNPEYLQKKVRGEGFTIKKAGAELVYPDGRPPLTKRSEVDSAICEILGVNRNQFLQIAMIAQGDFLKLLLSSTDDRKKIFRQIFKTELFGDLQDKLKGEAIELKNRCDSAKQSVKQFVEGVLCDEEDVLAIDLAKAKKGEIPTAEAMKVIETIVGQDEELSVHMQEELRNIEKALEQMNSNLGKIEEQNKARKELQWSEEELKKEEPVFETARLTLDAEKAKQSHREKLDSSIILLYEELPRYDEFEQLKKELTTTEKQLVSENKSLEENNEKEKEQEEKIAELRAERDSLEHAGENKEKLAGEKEKAEEKEKKLTGLKVDLEELDKLAVRLEEKQKQYKVLSERAEEAEKVYNEKNKAFLDEQAGILSERLQEGQPCPVCGSTSHPRPAKKSEKAPTEEELKQAKKDSEEARKKMETASKECAACKAEKDAKKGDMEKRLAELTDVNSPEDAEEKILELKNKLREEIKRLKTDIEAEEKKVKRKKEIMELLPKEESALEEVKRKIKDLQTSIASGETKVSDLKKQTEALSKKLQFDSKQAAELKIEELNAEKVAMQKTYEAAEQAYQKHKDAIIKLKGQIEKLREQLEQSCELDVEAERAKKAETESEKEKKTKEKQAVDIRLFGNKTALEQIKKKSTELIETESRYIWVDALSKTANGNINGKEKIMLETYIQMTYFERILARANLRLMVMSGGQYELKRRKEAENNRSQSGLELDVIDHYNGTERSVKTLSGGESFKASLSLALGLSDEIQSAAGGIRLDTMFVDEGFGSLDEESLNQAMKALANLTEGNRLVGIISHVSELKERIDKQLVVTKDGRGGSRVEIIS